MPRHAIQQNQPPVSFQSTAEHLCKSPRRHFGGHLREVSRMRRGCSRSPCVAIFTDGDGSRESVQKFDAIASFSWLATNRAPLFQLDRNLKNRSRFAREKRHGPRKTQGRITTHGRTRMRRRKRCQRFLGVVNSAGTAFDPRPLHLEQPEIDVEECTGTANCQVRFRGYLKFRNLKSERNKLRKN